MQLHETMFLNRSVILLGESGTGKSACYQTLCRSLCQFYSAWTKAVKKRRSAKVQRVKSDEKQSSTFSKVHLSTFYHKALTTEEVCERLKTHFKASTLQSFNVCCSRS